MSKISPLAELRGIVAFGADPEPKDPPQINIPPERKISVPEEKETDESLFHNPDGNNRLYQLGQENARRRNEAKDLRNAISQKDEEIAELRAELKNAEKIRKSYDKVKEDLDGRDGLLRRMAIHQAIREEESAEGEGKRAWYDVSMVFGLLDKDQIAVDVNDLTVGGLKEQLDKIAEEKPFLVKSAEQKDESRDRPGNQYPSGSAPSSSATGTYREQNASTENEMISKFPALQNLVK